MHISALSDREKRWAKGVWTLLQQLGDKDRLPTIAVAGPKCVRRVLNARHTFIGPNREPYYYFTEGNKQRVRSWFNSAGELMDADNFAIALQEVKAKAAQKKELRQARKEMNGVSSPKHPGRYRPVRIPIPGHRDMLSDYRSKVLAEQ
jgi:hypothetical protein